MEIKEIQLYTKNLESYTASEINELELMTDKELDEFQYEIEYGTGNISDWDSVRAIITLRNHIHDWETYANQMKELSEHWKADYYKMYGKYLEKEKLADELGVENRKIKFISNDLDLDYLISIEKNYGELIEENAKLIHFKDIATKYLTDEQLLGIKDKIDNVKDVDY